ncbi:uncharacterized protein N7529_000976 [Penicillium soppii]|uniref:uncharacterized protein n=1 Tax=Penicillium soppii TaxID=69789 RepID=UPI0025474CCE|nr:uncharacterized protein N7529_000976 [Penicillium soppii]KAJ5882304.1 hypothetical protein N7529_000976 [Penicillium soppii]
MASPSSTIIIEDDELPPNWRPSDPQFQGTSPRTSAEDTIVERTHAASGGIEPSRKRTRAAKQRPDTLDVSFKKLRRTVDQKFEKLEREAEKLQQKIQELQNELLQKEEQHQEELLGRRMLDCKICYEQPDCWGTMLCGHMACQSCIKKSNPEDRRVYTAEDQI